VPFELAMSDAQLVVDGAPDLLAQMLDKLISNAVEFRTSGPVVLRATRGPDGASIDVSNSGPCLPPGMGPRLFDSMVSFRTPGGGAHLGLGLFVARMIARYHGGSIEARDLADRTGVVVSVRLPLAGG
jgi:signal transduction histidine kinase